MAPAVSELWRSVAPEEIDTTLPILWREAASESPVSRALMSNLVVVRHVARDGARDDAPDRSRPADDQAATHLDAESPIVQIAQRHPARIILLNYSPSVITPCAPSRARVGVLTFGAATMRYGVEAIAVDAVCAEASVPSIVRRLTRGDVPTTLWWTADLSRSRPPGRRRRPPGNCCTTAPIGRISTKGPGRSPPFWRCRTRRIWLTSIGSGWRPCAGQLCTHWSMKRAPRL